MFYFGDNADREAVEFDFVASVYRPLQGPVRQPQSTSLFFRTHWSFIFFLVVKKFTVS